MNIFVVDDDPVVRHILGAILAKDGHQVTSLESGGECLTELQQAGEVDALPDILFIDMMLDDIAGTEIIKQLRASERLRGLPVVLISANPKEEMVNVEGVASANYYLEKPFVADTVLGVLAVVLDEQDENS